MKWNINRLYGAIGIMENHMATTIQGLGFRVWIVPQEWEQKRDNEMETGIRG